MANVDTIDITKLILVEQGSTPSTPASGKDKLFVRSSDHLLCLVDSSGTVTPYGGALTNPMSGVGDLIVGGSAGTPARLGIGSTGNLLNVSGGTPAWTAPGSLWPVTSDSATLTAASVNPTLGTGGTTGRHYIQIGKLVICWGNVTFGSSGVAAGTGEYHISLPVTSASTLGSSAMGDVVLFDSSAGLFNLAVTYFSSTSVARFAVGSASLTVTNAVPWTWAANDQINYTIIYEAA